MVLPLAQYFPGEIRATQQATLCISSICLTVTEYHMLSPGEYWMICSLLQQSLSPSLQGSKSAHEIKLEDEQDDEDEMLLPPPPRPAAKTPAVPPAQPTAKQPPKYTAVKPADEDEDDNSSIPTAQTIRYTAV